jgi:exonuclease III
MAIGDTTERDNAVDGAQKEKATSAILGHTPKGSTGRPQKRAKAAKKSKRKKASKVAKNTNSRLTQLTMEEATNHTPPPMNTECPANTATGTPQKKAPHNEILQPPHLIAVLNVMGIHSHKVEVSSLLQDKNPIILVGTEVKMLPGEQHNTSGLKIQTGTLRGYKTFFSITPASGVNDPKGKAGVTISLKETYAVPGFFKKVETPTHLNGNICHTTVNPPGQSPTHIVGVYMPEDKDKRARSYEHIKQIIDTCTAGRMNLVLAGDWNAVLMASDRTGPLDTEDRRHMEFCKVNHLVPLGGRANRKHTFHKTNSNPICSSRIDDILYLQLPSNHACQPAPEWTYEAGGTLDHLALLIVCPSSLLSLGPEPKTGPPPEKPAMQPGLKYPIKQAQLETTKARLESEIGPHHYLTTQEPILRARDMLLNALAGDRTADNIDRARIALDAGGLLPDVDALADALQRDLLSAHAIMLEECDKCPPHSERHCFKRSDGKKHDKLLEGTRALKTFLRETSQPEELTAAELQSLVNSMGLPPELQGGATVAEARAIARDHLDKAIQRAKLMREDLSSRQRGAEKAAFQSKLAKQPGKVHKHIFRDDPTDECVHTRPLTALRDPDTDIIHTDPAKVMSIAHQHFENLLAPTHVIKTGQYTPETRPPTRYPFDESANNPDAFNLTSHTWAEGGTVIAGQQGQEARGKTDLFELLADESTYNGQLKSLKKGKTPGPDDVPNELLKILPDGWHKTIHALYQVMWITGTTPTAWKESQTSLLYKKSDPYLVPNYRPIGMANALYKLWTSNVTYVMMHHALRHKIIHRCQEGGIMGRDTKRQLRNHINAFEDAHHAQQDLYCMYVDFSNAFNMVDHDKLLCIMYDLGIPTDAIEVVKGIYDGNKTVIKLPGGCSDPIVITRGTVQGDPLSPLLFILYIEPLLRWLHVGGRGYQFGCLKGKTDPNTDLPMQRVHALAALGFIDDTTIYTHTKDDMKVQLSKLEAYARWAGTPVNNSKCAATAILHGEAKRRGGIATNPERLTSLLGHGAALKMGDEPIPYFPPDKTYKYLGVHTCPAMLWHKQLEETLKHISDMGNKLARSLASPRQCLQILKMVIKPAVSYAFCVAPYTTSEIHQLDRAISRVARSCCRLPRSFPTAAILLDQEAGGMGLTSLTVDYGQVSTACLVRAVDDSDRLGLVTSALLDIQRSSDRGNAAVEEISDEETRFYTGLRQLYIMEQHGVQLTRQGEAYEASPPRSPGTANQDDGKLAALLRSSLVSHALMNPLNRIGVKHMGELITDDGTHIITTADLARTYGTKVTAREKRALNQLSVTVSGRLPPKIKSISMVRTTESLDKHLRALPAGLVQPPRNPHTRRATGSHDIRDMFLRTLGQQAPPARQQAPPPNRPPQRKLQQRGKTMAGQGTEICPPTSARAEQTGRLASSCNGRRQEMCGSMLSWTPWTGILTRTSARQSNT